MDKDYAMRMRKGQPIILIKGQHSFDDIASSISFDQESEKPHDNFI